MKPRELYDITELPMHRNTPVNVEGRNGRACCTNTNSTINCGGLESGKMDRYAIEIDGMKRLGEEDV